MHFVIIIIIIIIISVPSGYSTKQNTVQYKTRCAINEADSPSSGGLQVKINKEELTYIANNNFILFDINFQKSPLEGVLTYAHLHELSLAKKLPKKAEKKAAANAAKASYASESDGGSDDESISSQSSQTLSEILSDD